MATYDKEYIIRYVEGELTPEEMSQFEEALRNDPSLAAEVSLYLEVKQALQLSPDPQRESLLNTLKDLNRQYFGGSASASAAGTPDAGRRAKRIPLRRWVLGMAAAVSGVAIMLLLWPSKENYFDKLGHMEMISTAERGDNTDSSLQQASVYFNHQQFDKALPLLDKAVKADSNSQLALFYRGVAGWHMGATDAARADLEKVFQSGSLLQYEAAFYLALSYAAAHNDSTAKEWLKKIPADAPVSEKAKELAGKLR